MHVIYKHNFWQLLNFSDLKCRTWVWNLFRLDVRNYACTISRITTKFSRIVHVVRGVFLVGSATPVTEEVNAIGCAHFRHLCFLYIHPGLPCVRYEPDCLVSGWLVRFKISGQTGHTQIHRSVAAAKNNTRVGLAHSMASVWERVYNGGLGRSPQWGSRRQSRSGGKAPPPWSWWHFSSGTHIFALSRRLFTVL